MNSGSFAERDLQLKAKIISLPNMLHPYADRVAQNSKVASMGWLRLVGSLKLQVSFAKEPYKRDDILQKRPKI